MTNKQVRKEEKITRAEADEAGRGWCMCRNVANIQQYSKMNGTFPENWLANEIQDYKN